MFDCGPLGDGGHGHYDQLSVEAVRRRPAAGRRPRPLHLRRGRRRNWRHWFKGTAAHNTVCVDGLDQTPYRRGKPQGRAAAPRGCSAGATAAPAWTCCAAEVTSPALRRGAHAAPSRSWPASTGSCTTGCAAADPHDYACALAPAPRTPRRLRRCRPDGAELGVPTVTHRAADCSWLDHRRGHAGAERSAAVVEPGWVARDYGVKAAGAGRRA